MARNVEIKARLADPDGTRRRVAALADGPPSAIEQADTFFRVASGRLKLRETSGGHAELIFYERDDTPDPVESRYERVPVEDGARLRRLLDLALGEAGRVVKRRAVYRVGRTRVHLDEVQGLGWFLELEVELGQDEGVESGAAEARRLARAFAIPDEALVADAYVDLHRPGGRPRPSER